MERTVDTAAAALEELGAVVDVVDLQLTDPVDSFHVLWFAGASAVLKPFGDDAADHVDPSLRDALHRYRDYPRRTTWTPWPNAWRWAYGWAGCTATTTFS